MQKEIKRGREKVRQIEINRERKTKRKKAGEKEKKKESGRAGGNSIVCQHRD